MWGDLSTIRYYQRMAEQREREAREREASIRAAIEIMRPAEERRKVPR